MRRLVAAGLLPERAGQPVKAWVHISLADLFRLDGSSALQEQWTAQVRERWAAHRAFASETGSDGGRGAGGEGRNETGAPRGFGGVCRRTVTGADAGVVAGTVGDQSAHRPVIEAAAGQT